MDIRSGQTWWIDFIKPFEPILILNPEKQIIARPKDKSTNRYMQRQIHQKYHPETSS